MLCSHLLRAVQASKALAQPQHALQLPHCDPPGALGRTSSVSLPQVLVLLDQQLLGLHGHLRLEHAGKPEVSIKRN